MDAVYRSAPQEAINRADGRPPRLLDRLRFALRAKHDAWRTEQAYVQWVRRFILRNRKRHPQEMGGPLVDCCIAKRWASGSTAFASPAGCSIDVR